MDDLINRNLCDSCINNGCIFQSGIIRNHCDFYKAGEADWKKGEWIIEKIAEAVVRKMGEEKRMNNEEAAEFIRKYLIEDKMKWDKAMHLAFCALQRQIPKKPLQACGHATEMFRESIPSMNYCPICGQRIDWEGEEECGTEKTVRLKKSKFGYFSGVDKAVSQSIEAWNRRREEDEQI